MATKKVATKPKITKATVKKSAVKKKPTAKSKTVKKIVKKKNTFIGVKFVSGKNSAVIANDKQDQTIDMNVAQYPVEKGEPITDHAQINQNEVVVTGYAVGKKMQDARNTILQLIKWEKNGTLVNLQGDINDKDYLIQSLKQTFAEGRENAIYVEVTLIHIRIPSSPYIKNKTKKNSGKKQASKKPKAVYVKVKRGNTYWEFSMRYGTSIPQLRRWNKYPDRFIPIGVKLRVK